jgi:hypothetical protein
MRDQTTDILKDENFGFGRRDGFQALEKNGSAGILESLGIVPKTAERLARESRNVDIQQGELPMITFQHVVINFFGFVVLFDDSAAIRVHLAAKKMIVRHL